MGPGKVVSSARRGSGGRGALQVPASVPENPRIRNRKLRPKITNSYATSATSGPAAARTPSTLECPRASRFGPKCITHPGRFALSPRGISSGTFDWTSATNGGDAQPPASRGRWPSFHPADIPIRIIGACLNGELELWHVGRSDVPHRISTQLSVPSCVSTRQRPPLDGFTLLRLRGDAGGRPVRRSR